MKKIVTFVFLLCSLSLKAQVVKTDKELKSYVDAVLSLRQNSSNGENAVHTFLSQKKNWTLMDELQDENNAECLLTKKMKRFNLNPLINKILTERYGKNIPGGDFLNGEDPKFNYSLIEKGIKAKKTVKYTFQGRVGEQEFIIIPSDSQNANLSIKFKKGTSPLKSIQKKEKDGTISLHINTKLKSTDKITLEIENKTDINVAIVILNHNTRQ